MDDDEETIEEVSSIAKDDLIKYDELLSPFYQHLDSTSKLRFDVDKAALENFRSNVWPIFVNLIKRYDISLGKHLEESGPVFLSDGELNIFADDNKSAAALKKHQRQLEIILEKILEYNVPIKIKLGRGPYGDLKDLGF